MPTIVNLTMADLKESVVETLKQNKRAMTAPEVARQLRPALAESVYYALDSLARDGKISSTRQIGVTYYQTK